MPQVPRNPPQRPPELTRREGLKQVEDQRPPPGMTGIVLVVVGVGVADAAAAGRKGLRLSRKSSNLYARL
jgi:hypothetical protein